MEQQIAQLENDKDGIGEQIGKAGERQDLDAVAELSQKLQQTERQIAALYSEWENLATGLEEGLAETPMG